ncbi:MULTISPECIES: Eco29kI family restriction endonuclease [unclassified Desulfovibrio]|uniref:Eco29kI family restriction endonuclease n=1 Tax=unclassified Desulfovibrio TaxID=2593640 RepID=UPI000F60393E|nr:MULTISPECIES: Eco29kI family restriction endonuclease [unclassified Desulfovibrio]RRD71948.1 Eco29kI family restriction endonuclease [Desulfovibrio sp. OH1209_COT-279]RRD88161.1 Eco29kI family restriction endonuclease [Desulfovibrio sp. OH1186_COT-070]
MKEYSPYNPLAKTNLGNSVADAMLESDIHSLGSLEPFVGAGIYAIYYTGGFEAYRPLSAKNQANQFAAPIYVGKAVPPGARKGNFGVDSEPGQALYKRLREHAESIILAENLNIEDFFCRFLVVEDIWIPLGESLLIAKFSPVWNKLIDGFGNHDPGKGRYQQMRSKWDTLHPGREWALRCSSRYDTAEAICTELSTFLR